MNKITDPLAPGLRLLMKLARFVETYKEDHEHHYSPDMEPLLEDTDIQEWLRQMRSQKLI